jgi:phenylalanyl-tRNA synthetase alpha chain
VNDELTRALEQFRVEVAEVADGDALYALQVKYLGKKGSVTRLRAKMGSLDPSERKAFGQAFNTTKQAIEGAIEARKVELENEARQRELGRVLDLTMGARVPPVGSLHPITGFRRELERVFTRLGFDVEDGPHVEHEQYNFDDLNMGADHPARDMQDTFFVRPRGAGEDQGGDATPLVLRTHTSPVQVRTMLRRSPPIRIVAMGTVFRRDDDATHSPMFHQIEGLYVDRGVGMADLKATLYRFVGEMFGSGLQVRFRPSFFPFVEPGAEFDMQCPFCRTASTRTPGAVQLDPQTPRRACSVCKQTGWIELGGAGMVHPAVFEACGIDPEVHTGWAFGFGIDRMAALLHSIHDLRLMFEGDVRFLEQFPC